MDTVRWRRIDELFQAAVSCSLPQRETLLNDLCGNDPALRAEVESLLAAHEHASIFVDWPLFEPLVNAAGANSAELKSETVGAYRLIRQIGAGGTGAVYEAEQDRPRRIVALKILRSLPTRDELTARLFHRECSALARLQHPGIASIFEAGQTDDGWHYLAMERVGGRPLTEFAHERQLSIQERLQLFAAICDIVHYAHQRGVIHRDLKPSNILVTEDGEPKILDFGLARIIDSDLAIGDETRPGMFQGTPTYASPEQTRGRSEDIDARSDLYSLGVVLFELLTGQLPYRLDGMPLAEAAGVICEQTPVRAGDLCRALRGDPETILAKCLEKDPAWRYASAASLADDIRHYLNHEPIEARRNSAAYVLKKTMWRYRHAAAGVAAFVVLLIVGLVTVYVHWRHSDDARVRAEEAEAEQSRLRLIAVNARDQMEGLADRAERARRIAERREDQTGELVECFDAVLRNRGDFSAAIPRFEEALARAQADGEALHEANISQHLGLVLRLVDRNEDAKAHFLNALQRRREADAPPQRVVRTLVELGQLLVEIEDFVNAEKCFREAMKLTDKMTLRPRLLVLLQLGLGQALTGTGQFAEAEKLLLTAWDTVSKSERRSEMPQQEIVKALAGLYDAWSKPGTTSDHAAKAGQWRSKMESLQQRN